MIRSLFGASLAKLLETRRATRDPRVAHHLGRATALRLLAGDAPHWVAPRAALLAADLLVAVLLGAALLAAALLTVAQLAAARVLPSI
jgi:hypothetical protein